MTGVVRLTLEVGKKERRVVAGATDWPGLDRWGRIAGRSWPIQFLIRRIAHHAMDHAWEMEGRDTR